MTAGGMDELQARAHRQLDSLRSVNERLAQIRATESCPGGHVTAQVDGVGALTGLWFADSATELAADMLGEVVVATAAAAAGAAFARRAEILEDFNESFAQLVAVPAEHRGPPTGR